jgi:hypothetical protein
MGKVMSNVCYSKEYGSSPNVMNTFNLQKIFSYDLTVQRDRGKGIQEGKGRAGEI